MYDVLCTLVITSHIYMWNKQRHKQSWVHNTFEIHALVLMKIYSIGKNALIVLLENACLFFFFTLPASLLAIENAVPLLLLRHRRNRGWNACTVNYEVHNITAGWVSCHRMQIITNHVLGCRVCVSAILCDLTNLITYTVQILHLVCYSYIKS